MVYLQLNSILESLENEDINRECLQTKTQLEGFINEIKFGQHDK